MITEFCETIQPDGIYRKYAAFVVGDRVFPKNIQFSRQWLQKDPDLQDGQLLQEERRYVESNPRADQLRRVFNLARIQYGRVDYGLLDGRIQVWEINTNPQITSVVPKRRWGPRQAIYERTEREMELALDALVADDRPAPPGYATERAASSAEA